MARVGPCSAWITGDQVAAIPKVAGQIARILDGKVNGLVLDEAAVSILCTEAAAFATEMLYLRSGKVYTGLCGPVSVRPVARPPDVDVRAWRANGWGWSAGWGSASYYGLASGAVLSHFGSQSLSECELGDYPITQIIEIKIDGVVIPPDEYELRDSRKIVRLRVSDGATPTARWGWPTSQIGDLPDTEPGTFVVTYRYGTDPGAGGIAACKALAEFLVLPEFGDVTNLPMRTTSITRQGISAQIPSVMDLLAKGHTGIYAVDVWLDTVNPQKLTRQSQVWSPDFGRARRTQYPTRTGA